MFYFLCVCEKHAASRRKRRTETNLFCPGWGLEAVASPLEALFLFPPVASLNYFLTSLALARYHPAMASDADTTPPPQAIKLNSPISALHGIGPSRATKFKRLGIHSVTDLIRHLPMRYEFEHAEGAIGDLPMEGIGSARGVIASCRWVPGGKRGRFQATLQDHSDRLDLIWFNAAYLRQKLFPGITVRVQGKVTAFNGYPQMVNAKWERLDDEASDNVRTDADDKGDARLRPIYPSTEGLSSEVIESTIAAALPNVLSQITDLLPAAYVADRNMPTLSDAFRQTHQPANEGEAAIARRRLAFNELLLLQLGMAVKRRYNDTALIAPALHWSDSIDKHICARFPFELTDGQALVIEDLAADLQRDRPMNRLVQGDVGSGKTVVALYALLMAVADRTQGALMAPTELLAEQHFRSIGTMLEGTNVRIALLTASVKTAERQTILEDLNNGEVDIVVGTQSLLSDTVEFKELAVIVVDEQHRFGVRQRAALRSRGEQDDNAATSKSESAKQIKSTPEADRIPAPHCLVMTATPIPRTLSLTVFGDLDVSTIKGLPPGRTPITTRVVGPDKSKEVYTYLGERLQRGEQAYVVVPAIDESSDDAEKRLINVTSHAQLLQDDYFKEFVVASVHGRLKRDEREAIMSRFRAGEIDVLVATTVIEVGVDVPNATVMVVQHAERFGLSQLHQLRGRIGRGTSGSTPLCVFVADPTTDGATDRMAAIAATTDGFKIAESDLAIRGMGDFFGTRQHGLPPLRVAAIPEHLDLLQMARRDATAIIDADPLLENTEHELLRKVLIREYGETLGLVDVG